MYQTVKGPIIGHYERQTNSHVSRLWAPAMIAMPSPVNVIFMPLMAVEEYFDLWEHLVLGTHPTPELFEAGYRGYVEHFEKGAYRMQPVVVNAHIPGEAHKVELPKEETVLERCPACQQEVSNWQSHYPALVDVSPEGEVRLTDRQASLPDGWQRQWTCEIAIPDIRARFPDYEPPRPLDA